MTNTEKKLKLIYDEVKEIDRTNKYIVCSSVSGQRLYGIVDEHRREILPLNFVSINIRRRNTLAGIEIWATVTDTNWHDFVCPVLQLDV